MAIILGIESSCDETSVGICVDGSVTANVVATQAIHEKYGGVVPELASRAHIEKIVPVTIEALKKGNIELKQVDAIAFTQAPGLIGSLMVGGMFAKSLALANNKPLIAVNHMDAHVVANLIDTNNKPDFPFLCLTVSGGHTQIVLCTSPTETKILGETIDDAAGEAFDKAAKLLGLPYPGGPLIDKYATLGKPIFTFPKPQVPGLNFSFSGIKTAILYFLQNAGKSYVYKEQFLATEVERKEFIEENLPNICSSIQSTIIYVLLDKIQKAVQQTNITNVCLAGGVSANSGLRSAFTALGEQKKWKTFIPQFQYCTDNGGMIAVAGYYKYLEQQFADFDVVPKASIYA